MGIVFNLSSLRGSTLMENIDRAASRAYRAGLLGRKLYYEVLLIPTCSGRDVTALLAHRLSSVDGWDFGVPRALMATGDVPIVRSPLAPLLAKASQGTKGFSVPAAAQASFFATADPEARSRKAIVDHSASPVLCNLSATVKAELFSILAIMLHDFEVIGVLDNGLRYCIPFLVE
eukprot:GILI01019875.1.p1 GENE.GILI01019875.1~~GILI01019875.1.p1  ORF type:complete len:175 (+),score=42.55 GILI01019875.1:220-744(+)